MSPYRAPWGGYEQAEAVLNREQVLAREYVHRWVGDAPCAPETLWLAAMREARGLSRWGEEQTAGHP